ncbi:lipoate--protein ligase family protein [Rhodopirellula sp. P2]|uniref:lipoate--protein ligase family protein n=1 Tax=Rhodopirellula sp. P2 TaxID=2127060 RepID=UPI00236771F2|nr:lipoate--protein ligase family protein [Rhodopirellula sp. P2]WDQ18761.1 lipoate--protein ligase family protein [Rhodopirellula sp. P2]
MQLLNFKNEPRENSPEQDPRQFGRRQLARDEAMLQWADQIVEGDETTTIDTESLRMWQFDRPTVVLGRSSKINEEVNRAWCEERQIEVLRRCTGGASVVGGPGCWMYSVVLRLLDETSIRKIDVAHDHVMQRVLAAVQCQLPAAERKGICDLTFENRKFSGNSLRVARHHLLYHGTILIGSDLDLIESCLDFAPRQPEYRQQRRHREFVGNIEIDVTRLISDMAVQFGASQIPGATAVGAIEEHADELLRTRYGRPDWHTRR